MISLSIVLLEVFWVGHQSDPLLLVASLRFFKWVREFLPDERDHCCKYRENSKPYEKSDHVNCAEGGRKSIDRRVEEPLPFHIDGNVVVLEEGLSNLQFVLIFHKLYEEHSKFTYIVIAGLKVVQGDIEVDIFSNF